MSDDRKLWGGRFEKATDAAVDDFHSSIGFDKRLYRQDIQGSIAHATMLGEIGVLSPEDASAIVAGLEGLLADIEAGRVAFSTQAEDIHMNVESLLTQRIGDAGKRLHTGRSRNDQVALDARMYVKDAIDALIAAIEGLQDALMGHAQSNLTTILPGYTHLQKAQPITLAHHLMAYVEMLCRDIDRLRDAQRRADVMPLGSGALATTTYPLDRARVAELLGFARISRNSLDAVADRDFAIEFLSCCSMLMMHLSRLCEEWILWSTHEFGFLVIDDAYATGSSIMPQKKNPDVAELIRGKTGRVYGDLLGLLTTMKGLPLAYNKDMQEDKEALFDGFDTAIKCVDMFAGMARTARFDAARMRRGAEGGFTNATDAADYLVGKGLPFREAHEVIGRLVLDCIKRDRALLDLTLEELRGYSPLFEGDVFDKLSMESCVEGRKLPGGPAASAVRAHIDAVRAERG